jgi:hypothetical protein
MDGNLEKNLKKITARISSETKLSDFYNMLCKKYSYQKLEKKYGEEGLRKELGEEYLRGRYGNEIVDGTFTASVPSTRLFFCLNQISKHIDSIGDLKMLAESVSGFSRLKGGVTYISHNKKRVLPSKAMQNFGKKSFDELNKIFTKCNIEALPWVTKKYRPFERIKEKGWDWWQEVVEI